MTERYFKWLCDQIKCENQREIDECAQLFRHDFYVLLPNDINRAEDGLVFRENFRYETDIPADVGNRPCTVLEMMLAVARRMCFLMDEQMDPDQNTVHRWIFEMIDNLGKPRQRQSWDDHRWDDAICKVLDREYGYSGEGNLFPRLNKSEDQRTVEIWDQANGYLMDWYS